MTVWDNVSAGIGVLIQLAEFAVLIAALIWFIKRCIALDSEHRERATREPRAEELKGIGYLVIVSRPVGFFRWQAFAEIQPYRVAPPQPQIAGAITSGGKPIGELWRDDPRRKHAIEILAQTKQHPDFGESSSQLVTAKKFNGSPETWQLGKDFLADFFGVVARVGEGTYCGSQHPTVAALWRAVIAPLPQMGVSTNARNEA